MSDEFLYDDFFSPIDAPGIPVTVEVRGLSIPLTFRPVSTADIRAIQFKTVKLKYNSDGSASVESSDDQLGNDLLVCTVVKSWPFTERDGSPLGISPKSLSEMAPDVMGAILQKVAAFVKGGRLALDGPFEKA